MKKRLPAAIPLLIGTMGLAFAGQGTTKSEWQAPEAARAAPNPLPPTPEIIQEGLALYRKNCILCHGAEGKGDGQAGGLLESPPTNISAPAVQSRLTDGEIFWKMGEGRDPMPSFRRKLSEEERWKLVHYVRSLRAP